MLYELMKKAYFLPREDREFLYDNFDELMKIAKEDKDTTYKKLIRKLKGNTKQNQDVDTKKDLSKGDISTSYTHLPGGHLSDQFNQQSLASKNGLIKEAKNYDPETVDEMLKLVGLLEKFISIDDDISYDNICIFMRPLSGSSKKLVLRPNKLVGLSRKMESLSRQYQKNKENQELQLQIKDDFNNNLCEFKNRLSPENGRLKLKSAQAEDPLTPVIDNLVSAGNSEEEIVQIVMSMAQNLSYSVDEETIRKLVVEAR